MYTRRRGLCNAKNLAEALQERVPAQKLRSLLRHRQGTVRVAVLGCGPALEAVAVQEILRDLGAEAVEFNLFDSSTVWQAGHSVLDINSTSTCLDLKKVAENKQWWQQMRRHHLIVMWYAKMHLINHPVSPCIFAMHRAHAYHASAS